MRALNLRSLLGTFNITWKSFYHTHAGVFISKSIQFCRVYPFTSRDIPVLFFYYEWLCISFNEKGYTPYFQLIILNVYLWRHPELSFLLHSYHTCSWRIVSSRFFKHFRCIFGFSHKQVLQPTKPHKVGLTTHLVGWLAIILSTINIIDKIDWIWKMKIPQSSSYLHYSSHS